MRLARHGTPGQERPIVSGADGMWRDLSSLAYDVTPDLIGRLADIRTDDLAVVDAIDRFGPPLVGIGKIVCIGLNYRDHAAESGAEIPDEPIVFMKAPDTVIGPDDPVLVPRGSVKTDYEVELAVVIGRQAAYLDSSEQAAACIAGYAISHDVSERAFQLEHGGQWDKGKNSATFNPLGPWLLTADEVPDPQALDLRLWVNGELRQDGSTKQMIFGVHDIVRYVSRFMTLYPGDVINTGTPAGVVLGRPDQAYLRPGDVVALEIDGLGRQRQTFGAA